MCAARRSSASGRSPPAAGWRSWPVAPTASRTRWRAPGCRCATSAKASPCRCTAPTAPALLGGDAVRVVGMRRPVGVAPVDRPAGPGIDALGHLDHRDAALDRSSKPKTRRTDNAANVLTQSGPRTDIDDPGCLVGPSRVTGPRLSHCLVGNELRFANHHGLALACCRPQRAQLQLRYQSPRQGCKSVTRIVGPNFSTVTIARL